MTPTKCDISQHMTDCHNIAPVPKTRAKNWVLKHWEQLEGKTFGCNVCGKQMIYHKNNMATHTTRQHDIDSRGPVVWVWDHWERVDGNKCRCKHCGVVLEASLSTYTMGRHTTKQHNIQEPVAIESQEPLALKPDSEEEVKTRAVLDFVSTAPRSRCRRAANPVKAAAQAAIKLEKARWKDRKRIAKKRIAHAEKKDARTCGKQKQMPRPPSAFFLWLGDNHEKIESELGSAEIDAVANEAAQRWFAASAAEKEKYEEEAVKAKARWIYSGREGCSEKGRAGEEKRVSK
eukprot:Hpha_TRINITY_DN15840_c0_g1::TRINITY_DN15840_c0_g1_i4::g.191043::m.191043